MSTAYMVPISETETLYVGCVVMSPMQDPLLMGNAAGPVVSDATNIFFQFRVKTGPISGNFDLDPGSARED